VHFGSTVLHVQNDISVNENVESWTPTTAWGPIDERHRSRKDVISFTPVGIVSAALLDLLYAAHLAPGTKVGSTVLSGTVAIASLTENKTYTWQRGGMTKAPNLQLRPTSTAFGSMELTCIGGAAVQPTVATYWHAAEGVAAADITFEESGIISDIYSAALGARSAPYSAMGGMDGFEIQFGMQTADVPSSDVGIADIILSGVSVGASFAPSNLTEAQVLTLLGKQDTGAVLPGMSYAKANEDLVITGTQTGWVFTLKKVGAKRTDRIYAIGQHRFRGLEMVQKHTWTSGVRDALFAYTAP
jgi:hypothetical protein